MSAIDEIKALVDKAAPYREAPANLRELQLEAVRERFAEKRQQLKILDRRAGEAGIDEIRTLQDLVPLLFTHTNYKSYPETFVDKGQWGNMNLWLQTVTSKPVTGVNMDGIKDADDWVDRLQDGGHHLSASSGTSANCSFLDQTEADVALASKATCRAFSASGRPASPAAIAPASCFSRPPVCTACASTTTSSSASTCPPRVRPISSPPIRCGRPRGFAPASCAAPSPPAPPCRRRSPPSRRKTERTVSWPPPVSMPSSTRSTASAMNPSSWV